MVLAGAASCAVADITPTGEVSPDYRGADPWTIGTGLIVGKVGTGSLTVDAGSEVNSFGGVIGNDAGSSGTATVHGAGSLWAMNSSFAIGDGGNALLNIEDGGDVTSTFGRIATQDTATGEVRVRGAGSGWFITRDLWVGNLGEGTLTIEHGGFVDSGFPGFGGNAEIGNGPNSMGVATVTGSGSRWLVENELRVGDLGAGTLLVEAGGLVGSRSGVVGNVSGSSGDATITGTDSAWNIAQSLTLGIAGTGMLQIEDGGVVTTDSAVIRSTGTLKIDGGELLPTGEVTFDGGTFHKVIAGPNDPHITASGGLTIGPGSTLKIELAPGYTPAPSDTITLFNTSSNTLAPFDTLDLPALGNGISFQQQVLPSGLGNMLQLVVMQTLTADLSGDGDVDDEDLGLFFSGFTGPDNGPSSIPTADLSGDGDVDDEDLGDAFGQFTGPLAPINVPEPTSAAVLLLGAGLGARRRTENSL